MKVNLVKHEKNSKHYEVIISKFPFAFMFLLTADFLINSHIYGRIYFVSQKNVLQKI